MDFLSKIFSSGIKPVAEGASVVLNGIGDASIKIRQAIMNDVPAEKKAEIEMLLTTIDGNTRAGQIEINKIDAQSSKWWQAGWRPFVGWMCGCGFAYATIIQPLLNWYFRVMQALGWIAADVPLPPNVPTGLIVTVLGGMLGFGGMRSFERYTNKIK